MISSAANPNRAAIAATPWALSVPQALMSVKIGHQRLAANPGSCGMMRRWVSSLQKKHIWQQVRRANSARRSTASGTGWAMECAIRTTSGVTRSTKIPSSNSSATANPSSSANSMLRSKSACGIGRQAMHSPSESRHSAPLSATTPSRGIPAMSPRSPDARPVAMKIRTPRLWAAANASRVESGTRWVAKLTSVPSTSKKSARIIA